VARLLSGSACNDTVSTSLRATERAHAPSVDDDERCIPEQRELLWSVAHELRAPLTALTTASEILAEDASRLDPDEVNRLARTIQGVAHWLQAATDSLLTTAAIEAGHLRIARAPILIDDIVEEVLPVLQPLLSARRQQLRVRSDRGRHQVLADHQRIGQVIINLVSNASKYSPPSMSIDVTIEERQDRVRVVVADRGPGIAPDLQRRVFAPFFRTERALESGAAGSGLGLAIVKTIVMAHRGQVGVRNRVGGGARFWFELPALRETPLPFRTWVEGQRRKTG